MTGISLPWRMKGEQRQRVLKYYKRLISMLFIVGGASLMLEHLFRFEGFDLFDFAGHEYYGLALIVVGLLVSMKWSQWKEKKLWNPKNWIR